MLITSSDVEGARGHRARGVHGRHVSFVGAQRRVQVHHFGDMVDAGYATMPLASHMGDPARTPCAAPLLRRHDHRLARHTAAVSCELPKNAAEWLAPRRAAAGRPGRRWRRACMLARLAAVTSSRSFSFAMPVALIWKTACDSPLALPFVDCGLTAAEVFVQQLQQRLLVQGIFRQRGHFHVERHRVAGRAHRSSAGRKFPGWRAMAPAPWRTVLQRAKRDSKLTPTRW
jgi:hypothetical protein